MNRRTGWMLRHPIWTILEKTPNTWRIHYGLLGLFTKTKEYMAPHIRIHATHNEWMQDNIDQARRDYNERTMQ